MHSPLKTPDRDLRVRFMDAYGDGTVWAVIEDSQARATTVCIDGRESSQTRYRLFEGARHPECAGCALLELGSAEEGIVVSLMSHWLDSNKGVRWFTERGREIVIDTLLRIGASS